MKTVLMFVLVALAAVLTGCSNMGGYYASVDGANRRQVEIAQAYAQAEAVRYQSLMRIAESGDSNAKVAAAMALAMSGQGMRSGQQMAVPAPPQNEALQWASVLVPGVTQGMGIYFNAKTAMNASNNAAALGMHTNSTFAQFASEINSPTVVHADVVTQPAPVIVTQPDPIVVTTPAPTVVNPVIVPAGGL